MERKDIIFAYNMQIELERAQNELKNMPARMAELLETIKDREAKLRSIGL